MQCEMSDTEIFIKEKVRNVDREKQLINCKHNYLQIYSVGPALRWQNVLCIYSATPLKCILRKNKIINLKPSFK